jgi:excisionase family DNA binding protein
MADVKAEEVGEELMSIPAAALLLGVGRSTACALARKGLLPAKKVGRQFVVLRRDLEKFREERPPTLIRKYA